MPPVGAAERAAQSESALGEIEPVADFSARAVRLDPLYEVGVDAALHYEVFDKVSDLVFCEGAREGGAQSEAFSEAAGHIVFAAALPRAEAAGGAYAVVAGVEAQHDFPEGYDVELRGGFVFCQIFHIF